MKTFQIKGITLQLAENEHVNNRGPQKHDIFKFWGIWANNLVTNSVRLLELRVAETEKMRELSRFTEFSKEL